MNTEISKAKFWRKSIYWLLLLIVVLPVLNTTLTPEPTITIRNMFLSIFLLAYVVYFFFFKKMVPVFAGGLSKKLFAVLILFCLWNILAVSKAINTPESLFAIGQIVLLIGLIFIISDIVRQNPNSVFTLFKTLTLVGLFHAFIGILQFYEFVLIDEPGKVPYAFSANRTLYASSLALLLPFSACISLIGPRFWKIIGSISVVFILLAIILSQSRSAWLAVGMTFLFVHSSFLIYRHKLGKGFLKKWWLINGIGILLTCLLLFITYRLGFWDWLFQSLVERLQSFVGLADEGTIAKANIDQRIGVWQQCLVMIKDHWMLGVGPGNWKIVAPEYLSDLPSLAKGEYFLLRAHNSWLQLAVETGIPGLLIFLVFWGILIKMIIRLVKEADTSKELIIMLSLTSGLLVYAIDAFFSFPAERLEHGLYFSLIAGMIIGHFNKSKMTKPVPGWSIIVLFLLITAHLVQAVSHFKYQYYMQRTYSYLEGNQYSMAIEQSIECKNSWPTLGPNGDPIELMTASAFIEMGINEKAVEELLVARSYHPNNYKVEYLLGSTYSNLKRYDAAQKVYLRCLELTPAHLPTHYGIAQNLFDQKRYQECVQYIEELQIPLNKQLFSLLESCRQSLKSLY